MSRSLLCEYHHSFFFPSTKRFPLKTTNPVYTFFFPLKKRIMTSSADSTHNPVIHHEERYSLDVNELLRQQASRRLLERSKIQEVAALPVDPLENLDEEEQSYIQQQQRAKSPSLQNSAHHNHRSSPSSFAGGDGSNSVPRCHSPTTAEDNNNNNTVLIAQLKSRISILENESESLRAVVDLARKENAALRDLMLKLAKKSLGDDWNSQLGIDLGLGTALAGMGQPASELTWSQKERLIGMLNGRDPCLLP